MYNHRAIDEEERAQELGFEYPVSQADAIDDAMAALSRLQQTSGEETPEVEEEIVVRSWDDEQNEFEEYIMQ